MSMRPYLQVLFGLGIAASVACGAKPAISSDVSVGSVKRYSNGKVLDLNQLRVVWRSSDMCRALDSKYGDTTGRLAFDNTRSVLEKYPMEGVFRQGFGYDTLHEPAPADNQYSAITNWEQRALFIRESTEDPKSLLAIGMDIQANACLDPGV